jgi:hypothetical protein
MNRAKLKVAASLILSLIFGSATLPHTQAQDSKDAKNPYPSMAPLDQYFMDASAEIALARTAVPEDIGRDATVWVLGRHGYETAVAGKNGFVCVVERAWMAPFDSPEFWNPKNRSPDCYNPPAARTVLPLVKIRTEMVLAGLSKEQIIEKLKAAKASKEIPPLEPGGMAYMMSKQAYLTDRNPHNLSHVMFFVPTTDPDTWGVKSALSPVGLIQQDSIAHITTFLVVVGTWSDGTPVSASDGAAAPSPDGAGSHAHSM